MVIDLHRDGVAETTRLAATIDGKPMAQIMFFNGLCRTAARGPINSLPNEYLADNLAFSFSCSSWQMSIIRGLQGAFT